MIVKYGGHVMKVNSYSHPFLIRAYITQKISTDVKIALLSLVKSDAMFFFS